MRVDEKSDDAPVDGFGLVEVIVAMALLMVVAIAMLPIIVSSMYISKSNVSLATATQVVAEKFDEARFLPPTCAAMHDFDAQTLETLSPDPQGVVLEVDVDTPTACPLPGAYPAAFRLTVTVTDQETGLVIAQAESRVLITSED